MRKLTFVATFLFVVMLSCNKINPGFDWIENHPVKIVEFSIPSDSIKIDPYGYSPLSARVNFSSPVSGKTMITIKGKHGEASDIEHVFEDYGFNHSIPLIGLYADYTNTVYVSVLNNKGDILASATVTIRTGALPVKLATIIEADILPTGGIENGINLVSNFSVNNPQVPLMVDNYGDIRWLLNYSSHPILKGLFYDNGIKRLRNGNFYFGDITSNKMFEVDLLGKVIHICDLNATDYTFHHDIDEKPDGNLIVSATKKNDVNSSGSPTKEDYVLDIGRETGLIRNVWDLKESLDEYRTTLNTDLTDWLHVNAVLYDSTDNSIIVSGRHQGVAKLSYDNKVKWVISPHKGWGVNRKGQDMNRFLLTPLDAGGFPITDTAVLNGTKNHPDFEWSWYQHSTILMPNGSYMLFDNGDLRNYGDTASKYSRAVEYKIDPVKMTIQQKWQYGKERGLESFSYIVSSVQFLPNTGHVLFCPGYKVKNAKGLGGKIIEVDYLTKKVVMQLSFSAENNWGFHRAKRVSLYP